VTPPGEASETPGPPPEAFAAPERWPTGRLLSAAARRVERAWDSYLHRWGLTHASLPVLAVLVAGPLSQREIAARLHVTEQSVGRMLPGLQERGYIDREPHPGDRRRRVVTLSVAGREALGQLDQPQAVEALVGSALSSEETIQLRRLLQRIVARLPGPGDAAQ